MPRRVSGALQNGMNSRDMIVSFLSVDTSHNQYLLMQLDTYSIVPNIESM